MVPRPETPEPSGDGGGGGEGAPSLDPLASDILVQPATIPVGGAATPTRRNRRPRDASTSSANTNQPNDPASQSAHLQPTGTFPTEQDLESKYVLSSSSSLRRHVLSPAGGGRVVRRPVVERTLTRLCTLALPPLDGSEDVSSETAAARGSADTSRAGNLAASDDVGRASTRQRSTSGMSAGDAAAIAAAAGALTPADESDGRSISSRMSHATGTTAPVTNTASSVANTTAVTTTAHDHGQQLEASFPPARPNFAPGCQPILVFGRYVAAAADDGRVCLFAVKSFEDNVDITDQSIEKNNEEEGEDWDELERMKERINRIEDERSAVLPLATVGPFRIGGGLMSKDRDASASVSDEFDLPGCIVALAATPEHVALPTYRRRKKRRRPGDAEDEGDDDSPPPPPKAGHSFLGHIAALTSEGDVHVLQVYESDNDPKYISRPFVQVLASFSSMTFCATCICIRQSQGRAENDEGTFVPAMRVCVGHDNGIIGEWEIVITCDAPFVSATGGIRRPTLANAAAAAAAETKEEAGGPVDAVSAAAGALDKIALANHHSRRRKSEVAGADEDERHDSNDATSHDMGDKEEKDTPELPEPKEPPQPFPLKYSIPRPRLMWAGHLDAPIRSLSSLGNGSTGEDAELVQFQQTHVAIGLVQRAKSLRENPIPSASTSLPPSLAIEVVDALQAEAEWQQARSKRNDVSPSSKGLDPVPLFDLCTWPGIGMEIRDGSIIPDLQSGSGSDYMTSRVGNDMVHGACLGLGSSPGFAIAVSDGTVAVSDVVKQGNDLPAWGVASNKTQLFLPGPPIGMGCFNPYAGGPAIAYCLQGGLLFAVPAAGSDDSSRAGGFPQVVLYQYPFDLEGDDDEVVRFAHGFVAGDINILEIGGNKWQQGRSAVVGFSWAGGVMDIFGCVGL